MLVVTKKFLQCTGGTVGWMIALVSLAAIAVISVDYAEYRGNS